MTEYKMWAGYWVTEKHYNKMNELREELCKIHTEAFPLNERMREINIQFKLIFSKYEFNGPDPNDYEAGGKTRINKMRRRNMGRRKK